MSENPRTAEEFAEEIARFAFAQPTALAQEVQKQIARAMHDYAREFAARELIGLIRKNDLNQEFVWVTALKQRANELRSEAT